MSGRYQIVPLGGIPVFTPRTGVSNVITQEPTGLQTAAAEALRKKVDISLYSYEVQLQIFVISRALELPKIREIVKQSIAKCFSKIYKENIFLSLGKQDLVAIIEQEDLNVESEDTVFDCVLKWLDYNIKDRKAELGEVLQHVRLAFCTTDYFNSVVEEHPYFEDEPCQGYLSEARKIRSAELTQHEFYTPRTVPRRYFDVSKLLLLASGGESLNCLYLDGQGTSGRWKAIADLNQACHGRSVCIVPQGILVTGGWQKQNICTSQCFLLETHSNEWKQFPDMMEKRLFHGSVCQGNSVYVIGGLENVDEDAEPKASVEICNTLQPTWNQGIPLPEGLAKPMVTCSNQCIYVLGGQPSCTSRSSAKVYALHSNQDAWIEKAPMPKLNPLAAAVCYNGSIYIVGGMFRSCMSYQILTDSWTILHGPRSGHMRAPAAVWQGRILLAGGAGCYSVEQYDPTTNTWSPWHPPLTANSDRGFLMNICTKKPIPVN